MGIGINNIKNSNGINPEDEGISNDKFKPMGNYVNKDINFDALINKIEKKTNGEDDGLITYAELKDYQSKNKKLCFLNEDCSQEKNLIETALIKFVETNPFVSIEQKPIPYANSTSNNQQAYNASQLEQAMIFKVP